VLGWVEMPDTGGKIKRTGRRSMPGGVSSKCRVGRAAYRGRVGAALRRWAVAPQCRSTAQVSAALAMAEPVALATILASGAL